MSSTSPLSLKTRVFSSSSLKNMLSNPNSGCSTPRKMEKTDSVVNLTKPSLYGIYNDNSVLNLNQEYENVEGFGPGDEQRSFINNTTTTTTTTTNNSNKSEESGIVRKKDRRNKGVQLVIAIGKVAILTTCAFLYNEATKNIHNSHIKVSKFSYEPLAITHVFLTNFISKFKPLATCTAGVTPAPSINYVDNIFALLVQGLVMGLIQPLWDYMLPPALTKRLLSSSPNSSLSNANILNDLIRSLVTFLGISYAVRKIEWSSSLQLLIFWSLLNPGLWLLLDGTVSGFLSSLTIATLACICVYIQNYDLIRDYGGYASLLNKNEDFIALWLWIGSFFFCGLIIFGKLGRGLFGRS